MKRCAWQVLILGSVATAIFGGCETPSHRSDVGAPVMEIAATQTSGDATVEIVREWFDFDPKDPRWAYVVGGDDWPAPSAPECRDRQGAFTLGFLRLPTGAVVVTVAFWVAADGRTERVEILSPCEPVLAERVRGAVEKWRYRAAIGAGRNQVCRGYVELRVAPHK